MANMKPRVVQADQVKLVDMPVEPSGEIASIGGLLVQTPDRRLTGGLWECQAGRFDWKMDGDEIAYLFEGSIRITTEEGDTCQIGPGDIAYFPEIMQATWEILEPIKMFFVVRTSDPFPPKG